MPKLNLENWKHIVYAPTQKNKTKQRNLISSFIQNASNSKMKKKATRTQEAKKILKKKFKVNTRIVFTEEGEVR